MQSEITKHIAGHSKWKQRLRQAIDTGQSEWEVAGVKPDNLCEFGKWVHAMPPDVKSTDHCKKVIELHARFHVAAAAVLDLALSGKKEEAEKAVAMGGEFSTASVQLTQAMMHWKRSLDAANAA